MFVDDNTFGIIKLKKNYGTPQGIRTIQSILWSFHLYTEKVYTNANFLHKYIIVADNKYMN